MQQTITSTHFPTKLERLTSKVTKLLSQKYKFQGGIDGHDEKDLQNHIKLSSQDIENAVQKSQQMTSKLKLLRTLLGYQYQSSKKQKKVTTIDPEQKHNEEKGVNLKQFVISMRKKNQITDKYFKHRKTNSISSPQKNFEQQSKSIQQYTDASLKYVHSFLPHQTTLSTLQHIPLRSKKSVQFISSPTNYMKNHQSLHHDRSFQTIQNENYEGNHNHSGASLQRQQHSIIKSKRSLHVCVYNSNNSPKYRFPDNIANIKQQADRVQRVVQIYKKQSINLPLVEHQSINQRRGESNCTAPSDIYANKVTGLVYKGKYYNKQLKNHVSLQRTVYTKQKQQKKGTTQLFPMIKQCVPKNRSKLSNVAS